MLCPPFSINICVKIQSVVSIGVQIRKQSSKHSQQAALSIYSNIMEERIHVSHGGHVQMKSEQTR